MDPLVVCGFALCALIGAAMLFVALTQGRADRTEPVETDPAAEPTDQRMMN